MIPFNDIVQQHAAEFKLEPNLIRAIIIKESSWNPYAWNPEPHYRYLWNVATDRPFRVLTVSERIAEVPPRDFPFLAGDRDQEWWAQQASWGLMQIMGAVAREYGFRGPYLPELVDPGINIRIGCKVLTSALRWANGDVRKAVASYNGGRGNYGAPEPQAYAATVLRHLEKLKSTQSA